MSEIPKSKFNLGDEVTVTREGDEKPFEAKVTADPWYEEGKGWFYKVRDAKKDGFVVKEAALS